MKDQKKEDLQKRVKADSRCTKVITGCIGVAMCFYAIYFITSIVNGTNNTDTPSVIFANLVRIGMIFAMFVLLSMFMNDLQKNGKPFTKKNIKRLRVIAILTMFTAVLPEFIQSIAGFFDAKATFTLTLTLANGVLLLLGVIFGIISEVFVYGYELEEEMDSIA
jgi:hypothetical protein